LKQYLVNIDLEKNQNEWKSKIKSNILETWTENFKENSLAKNIYIQYKIYFEHRERACPVRIRQVKKADFLLLVYGVVICQPAFVQCYR